MISFRTSDSLSFETKQEIYLVNCYFSFLSKRLNRYTYGACIAKRKGMWEKMTMNEESKDWKGDIQLCTYPNSSI